MSSKAGYGCLYAVGIVAAVGTVGLVGCSLFVSSLTNAIFPGSGGTVHWSSMDPYDMYFRDKYQDDRRQSSKNYGEWHLAVPKAFVTAIFGSNGSTAGPHTYLVWLGLDVNAEAGSIQPLSTLEHRASARELMINLGNLAKGNIPHTSGTLCKRQDTKEGISKCNSDSRYECTVEMNYNGWYFEITPNVDVYNGSNDGLVKDCETALSFLKAHTLTIDNMLIE